MTILETLVATRALLTPPEHWTKGASQRDANGNKCHPGDAVCWCLVGALYYIAPPDLDAGWHAARLLEDNIPHKRIDIANDDPSTTHADVLHWLDVAIERAELEA
jgi:hypothetical protein